jgi:hypothetical protein
MKMRSKDINKVHQDLQTFGGLLIHKKTLPIGWYGLIQNQKVGVKES